MFFKNKSLVVNVVDNAEFEEVESSKLDHSKLIQEITTSVAILMGTWVALDTLRQCTVYTATVKIK